MSDREEEDFGFETEPDKQPPALEEEEVFSIDTADEEGEDFSLGGFDDEDADFSIETADEEPVFDEQPETAVAADLFSVADEEPATLADEGPVEEENFILNDDASGPEEQKSSPARLLILVGLLVVFGGVAFYFLGMPEGPSSQVPSQVVTKKQPIALPAKPIVKSEEIAPAKVAAAVSVDEKAKPASASAVKSITEKPVAEVKVESPALAVAKPATQKPKTVAATPKFQVQVGAYLLVSNLTKAEKTVEKLGFEPRRTAATKKTSMVRLKAGSYSRTEGPAKLAELKKTAASAFILYDGDQATVYAGSYLDLDKARRHADLLWEKGIRVEEVKVDVEIPLHRLSFGGFADKASADAAAKKARDAGLDSQVLAYKRN